MPNGARHYAFTLNNYSDDDLVHLTTPPSCVVYLVFGKEVAASGTPHLQGHVYFSSQQSIRQAKRLLGIEAHFSVARNVARSIEYCKKDREFTEYGTSPEIRSQSGKRSDFDALRGSITEGTTSMQELRALYPDLCARYPRFVLSLIRDLRPLPAIPDYALRDWQSELVEYVSGPVDPRKIRFLVDPLGNQGKSYIAAFLEHKFDNVQVMQPGKIADMALEYNEETEILLVDIPRCKMANSEYLYPFLESIKDGRLFSPKYESYTKRFTPPHVIVLMNESPDGNALSQDRYDIKHISPN